MSLKEMKSAEAEAIARALVARANLDKAHEEVRAAVIALSKAESEVKRLRSECRAMQERGL